MKLFFLILIFSICEISASPLIDAVSKGDIDEVKILLKKEKNLNAKDAYGKTALIYAVEEKNIDIVKTLLDAGADPEVKDKKGKTPLFIASQKRDSEFNNNENSEETNKTNELVDVLIDSIRKKSIPKIPKQVLIEAQKEDQVRNSPKNIFEYLLILPTKLIGFTKEELNLDYGLRFKYFQEVELNKNCGSEKATDCIEKGFEILDFKNGYLFYRINGLEDYIQMALFKKSDGSHLIGVTKYFGGDSGESNTSFLIYKNQKWINVTNKILPELNYKLFLSPNDYKLIGSKQKREPRAYISLPRYGTDITYYAENVYSCEGDMSTSDSKKCKMIMKKRIRDFVKLKWSPEKGIFILK